MTYSGRSIARNAIFNLLGYGVPLIFALILIPPLINGLGTERFGILTLSWMIIGYFSFFDFGIGKGLTKIIAEKIGLNQLDLITDLFWTSLFLMLAISLLASLIIFFFVPSLVDIFNISEELRPEAIKTFYVLAISIPVISTTAGLRGVLEAYQKFGVINIIRILLGTLTFLIPLLVLVFINSLFWMVTVLVMIRVIIWMFYLLICFRVNSSLIKNITYKFASIKPVLRFSIWITILNIVGPIIIYSDRFLIGALISAAAITFYATPYEVASKLLLIPGALTGVLFPVFSASFSIKPGVSKKILLTGVKFIFLILFPIVFIIVTFAFEGMQLWLGNEFAINSSLILQFLSIGIFMNCLSSMPNNFFQGIGKPKIPTLINMSELPFYILLMWFSIEGWGIKGAAFAYMFAAIIDAFIMYLIANRKYNLTFESRFSAISFLLLMIVLGIPFFISGLLVKGIFTLFLLLIFIILAWRYFLSGEEKSFILSKIRISNI